MCQLLTLTVVIRNDYVNFWWAFNRSMDRSNQWNLDKNKTIANIDSYHLYVYTCKPKPPYHTQHQKKSTWKKQHPAVLQLSSHTKWSWIVSVFNIGVLVVVKDMTMTANDKETSWRREEKSPQYTMSEYVVENKFFLFLCAVDLTLLKSAPY